MFFSSIIGQEAVKQRLRAMVQEERIPHALLLCGGEGIGKLPLAIALAQYVCCEHRTQTDACGVCPSCVKYAKLAHPDLHFVFPIIKPESKTKAVCDDFIDKFRSFVLEQPYGTINEWINTIGSGKQGIIYEAESGEILRKLALKTYESEYKVMIIWQPEKAHISCSNKLLKILEEPPAKTLFILVSEAPDMLLSTIQSRTQRIAIPTIERNEIEEALQRHFSITPESATSIARIANGNYRKAIELTEASGENKFNFEQFVYLMRTAFGRKVGDLKQWSEMMSKIGREKQKSFFVYAQNMVRENFIFNLHDEDLNYMENDETAFSVRFSPYINEQNIEAIMNDLALAERHIEGNVQAKMVFFDLSLKFIVSLIKKS